MWQRRGAWLGGGSFQSTAIYLFAARADDDGDDDDDCDDDDVDDDDDDDDDDVQNSGVTNGKKMRALR